MLDRRDKKIKELRRQAKAAAAEHKCLISAIAQLITARGDGAHNAEKLLFKLGVTVKQGQ